MEFLIKAFLNSTLCWVIFNQLQFLFEYFKLDFIYQYFVFKPLSCLKCFSFWTVLYYYMIVEHSFEPLSASLSAFICFLIEYIQNEKKTVL
jgi:hypothetical protein